MHDRAAHGSRTGLPGMVMSTGFVLERTVYRLDTRIAEYLIAFRKST